MNDIEVNPDFVSNPFAILDVTTRDGTERIMKAAEERSMIVDPGQCQEARATLTNPRRRLEAELGWFPGVSPVTATRAASVKQFRELEGLPLNGLAKINAMLASVRFINISRKEELTPLLKAVSVEAESINPDAVLRDINKDREVAGFPPVPSINSLSPVLADRRREWRRSVTAILTKTPTLVLVAAFHDLADNFLIHKKFPHLFHEIIDDYSLQAQPYIQSEIEASNKVIAKIRELAPTQPDALPPLINVLEQLLTTWEHFTRPMQISSTLLGRVQEDSEHLAYSILELSTDLFNDPDMSEQAQNLLTMVISHFQATPDIIERIAEVWHG